MENGLEPVKILVIVLVVVVQGVAAFRAWMKKREQVKRQEEDRLGFPNRDASGQNREPSSEPSDDLMDWDPLGENEPEQDAPQNRPEPIRKPATIVFPPLGSVPEPPRSAPVAADPEHSHSASETSGEGSRAFVLPQHHRFLESGRKQEAHVAKLPGDGTLRTAMLAKMILERPLSARGGYPRAVRD